MLTRVKRKISKQMNHEKLDLSAEKSEKPEESPGRKHSTVERKQSRAERKRSAAERKQALKSSDSNPEKEYFMYEMQGLQAEVNTLRNQLQEETKRSQDLKSLKTQQVCALTFKLASAIRKQEKAEENAARAMAEMERFRQSQVTDINGCANVISSIEESEESGKLRRISEESGKLDERQENCRVSDDGDNSKGNDSADLTCCRKTGIIISQIELQKMMLERREESVCDDSGCYSFYAESDVSSVKNQHDAETQTPVQDTSVDEDSASSTENVSTHHAYQGLVSQELALMQEELREVKGNMSMVRALNQRLSEDLQKFSTTYERLQGQNGGLCPCILDKESKRAQNNENREDQLSIPVSPRPGIVSFVSEGHHGSDVVDVGICEPQVEVETCAGKLEILEEKVAQVARDINLAESELEKPSGIDDCGSAMGHHKIYLPQEARVPQEGEKETLGDSEMKTKSVLRQVKECEEPNEVKINKDDDHHSTKEKKTPDVATVQQMELLKEQLKIAMIEIDKLRLDNSDVKRELRNISTSTGIELLLKTSKFTDQLLSEMKKRETTIRSHDTYASADILYPSTLELDNYGSGVSPPKTVTLVQCPRSTAQPGMPRSAEGLERSSRPSLPNRLHETTETSGEMTERPKKPQELAQMCVLDPSIRHSSDPVNYSFEFKRRYQRPVKGEPFMCSSASERIGFNPVVATSKGALVACPEKLGELGVCSASSVQLVERMKPGFFDEERSKPLDFSGAIRHSSLVRDAWKPSMHYNDYIQRHIVRSSDYIAKLRDLKPEELVRPQEDSNNGGEYSHI